MYYVKNSVFSGSPPENALLSVFYTAYIDRSDHMKVARALFNKRFLLLETLKFK